MENQSSIKRERDTDPLRPNSELTELYLSLEIKQRFQMFPDTARAAEIVGVSQRTIQFWIEIGRLTAIQVGRKYRIHLAELKKCVRSSEV